LFSRIYGDKSPDIIDGLKKNPVVAAMNWWWCRLLEHHAKLDLHSAISLKQLSTGRNVTPLGDIILIQNQPVFALTFLSRVA
jgi:hypothetical protein